MEFFKHFIPDFFPKKLVNYSIGSIEFFLGIGLFFSQTSKLASIGVFVLLIFLLPIHIWDLSKDNPAIGSKKRAIVRIFIQFLLICGVYFVYIHS